MRQIQKKDISLGSDGFAIAIAWPESWAKAPEPIFKFLKSTGILKSRFFQVGHAALLTIESGSGEVSYLDFGRYTSSTRKGRVRSRETDPKLDIPLKAVFGQDGGIENIEEILLHLDSMSKHTHGDGAMYTSLPIPIHLERVKDYYKNLQLDGLQTYATLGANTTNCARFVYDAFLEGATSPDTLKRLNTFPLSYVVTPIGNIEMLSEQLNIIVKDKTVHYKKGWGLRKIIRFLFKKTIKSFTGKQLEEDRFPNNLSCPSKPRHIPHTAQWLPGLGESQWINIDPYYNHLKTYKVSVFSKKGVKEYEYIGRSHKEINFKEPYNITYPSSKLYITIQQDSTEFRIVFVEDFHQKVSVETAHETMSFITDNLLPSKI